MTGDLIAVSAIGVAILFGAMSPGASFLLVARMAMSVRDGRLYLLLQVWVLVHLFLLP